MSEKQTVIKLTAREEKDTLVNPTNSDKKMLKINSDRNWPFKFCY